MVTPPERRAVVAAAQAHFPQLTQRQACRYLDVPRALVRYVARRDPQLALRARLHELAVQRPRWGSPRLTWRLRRDGWRVNPKRIARLCRVDRLLVGQRPRKKRVAMTRVPTSTPTRPNERWSMDFMRDTTTEGRPFRTWAVVDDFTKESPGLLLARSLPTRRVIEALDAILLVRPAPRTLVCDNGPEFTSLALDQWAHARGITLDFIRPGHPVENCFIESFNGKFRDECLNQHHFESIPHAQQITSAWHAEYHTERPHQSLGQRTPAEFAALFTPEEGHSSLMTLRS